MRQGTENRHVGDKRWLVILFSERDMVDLGDLSLNFGQDRTMSSSLSDNVHL